MLTMVEVQRRFNDGNAACEAAWFDLLECQHDDPCCNMLHIELSSSDPAHPSPDVFEAYEASACKEESENVDTACGADDGEDHGGPAESPGRKPCTMNCPSSVERGRRTSCDTYLRWS